MSELDFEQQSLGFLDWFKSLPGATFHKDIRIEDLRHKNAGRGIIATVDLEPETVLFTIPRRSILCARTSELPSKIPEVFRDGDDDSEEEDGEKALDNWSALILIMMYEYLQGANSIWKSYFDILPATFDTPLFWTDAELNELQASSVVSRIGKADVSAMIRRKVVPVIRAHEALFFPEGQKRLDDACLETLAGRMGSTIMGYAFDLENEDDDDDNEGRGEDEGEDEWVEDREGRVMLGMVPMADMLNADAEFNAHINHGEDALTATALRPIRAGEEVFNYYGPLPNGELLRRYGYVTERHARHDVAELPWDLLQARLRERLRVDQAAWETAMQQVDPDEIEDGFVVERQGGEPDSTGQMRDEPAFLGLPDELTEQVKTVLKAVKKTSPEHGWLDDKSAREDVCLDAALRALQDREAQFSSTVEEDEMLIQDAKVEGRRRMAVQVRLGEKLLLRRAQSWVSTKLADRQGGEDERAKKRQRTDRA